MKLKRASFLGFLGLQLFLIGLLGTVVMGMYEIPYFEIPVSVGIYCMAVCACLLAINLYGKNNLRDDVQAGIDQANRGDLYPADEAFARLKDKLDTWTKNSTK